jgi:hypothetical protein
MSIRLMDSMVARQIHEFIFSPLGMRYDFSNIVSNISLMREGFALIFVLFSYLLYSKTGRRVKGTQIAGL